MVLQVTTMEPSFDNNTMINQSCGELPSLPPATITFISLYTLICLVGLVGNGLVIFVVLRYTKMKTVTNMYIFNLAVADLCFLVSTSFSFCLICFLAFHFRSIRLFSKVHYRAQFLRLVHTCLHIDMLMTFRLRAFCQFN